MPRRRSKVGGARPGAGRPPSGNARTVQRMIRLHPAEASAQDAAAAKEGRPWAEWARQAFAAALRSTP